MAERLPVIDEDVHGQMASLVGPARLDRFLGILEGRLGTLAGLDAGPLDAARLAEVHKVVSEAGCMGLPRLAAACRSLEQAVRHGPDEAVPGRAAAAASEIGEGLAALARLRTRSMPSGIAGHAGC